MELVEGFKRYKDLPDDISPNSIYAHTLKTLDSVWKVFIVVDNEDYWLTVDGSWLSGGYGDTEVYGSKDWAKKQLAVLSVEEELIPAFMINAGDMERSDGYRGGSEKIKHEESYAGLNALKQVSEYWGEHG